LTRVRPRGRAISYYCLVAGFDAVLIFLFNGRAEELCAFDLLNFRSERCLGVCDIFIRILDVLYDFLRGNVIVLRLAPVTNINRAASNKNAIFPKIRLLPAKMFIPDIVSSQKYNLRI
jgi:hypothetical protein